jgi:hypothetical protein
MDALAYAVSFNALNTKPPGMPYDTISWQVGNKLAKNTVSPRNDDEKHPIRPLPAPDHIRPIGGAASPSLIIVIRI